MNVFSKKGIPEPNFPRNTFDMSRQDMLTTEWAKLMPVYCKEVLPGDSWQIDSSITVNAMPTVFPLSTPVKVYMHYYYVRNRTLYKDFEDFIFKTKDGLTPPYLSLPVDSDSDKERVRTLIGTRSYGDCFGVPSTFAGNIQQAFKESSSVYVCFPKSAASYLLQPSELVTYISSTPLNLYNTEGHTYSADSWFSTAVLYRPIKLSNRIYTQTVGTWLTPTSLTCGAVAVYKVNPETGLPYFSLPLAVDLARVVGYDVGNNIPNYFDLSDSLVSAYNDNDDTVLVIFRSAAESYGSQTSLLDSGLNGVTQFIPFPGFPLNPSYSIMPFTSVSLSFSSDGKVDITKDDYLALNPFVGDDPSITLSALPWRAMEQIYNYYYRNDINNPYQLNGEVQYNEFIPSHDGGADANDYPIRYRNWELDRYTSCAPSPQYGDAPLVGLVGRPSADTATVQFADSDGNTYNATVGIDSEGNVDSIVDYDRDIPSGSLRYIEESVTSPNGFSINDLRSVNSFQRFLENTIRRGLRYRNQLKSHFGVTVDYPDIDVPQFIGGYSGTLNTPRVMQSATTAEANLGDFNGQIVGTVSSQNTINCYCPEHGFIIGVMSIIPVPVYSQTLDPMLTRVSAFDYFQQEFSKIGNVPIYMKEVAPVQASDPSTVFGYQKAHSEYMQDYDRVHGDFRTTLSDFMLMRTFADEPTLSTDFTVASPDQMNDVFAAGKIADEYGSTDRLLCQVNHRVSAKRQIPRYGTPSLE